LLRHLWRPAQCLMVNPPLLETRLESG
jgi:hypothetical protein